jgi:hypothetical protein
MLWLYRLCAALLPQGGKLIRVQNSLKSFRVLSLMKIMFCFIFCLAAKSSKKINPVRMHWRKAIFKYFLLKPLLNRAASGVFQ